MAVQIPIPVDEIDLDAAAQRFAAIHTNRGIAKIRAGFPVPGAKLDDVDLVAGSTHKIFTKFAGEPARLELEFVRCAQREKKRAFVDTTGNKKFGVAGGAILHALIVAASLCEARFKSRTLRRPEGGGYS